MELCKKNMTWKTDVSKMRKQIQGASFSQGKCDQAQHVQQNGVRVQVSPASLVERHQAHDVYPEAPPDVLDQEPRYAPRISDRFQRCKQEICVEHATSSRLNSLRWQKETRIHSERIVSSYSSELAVDMTGH